LLVNADAEDRPVNDPRAAAHETPDFMVIDALDLADYTDRGVVITLVNAQGDRLRLHVDIRTGELLCERIAHALECRYGR
jgi:hypothetical protein